MSSQSDPWVRNVETEMEQFATRHRFAYTASARELSASFEIGCFHAVLRLYGASCTVRPENLQEGKYRYLTTPSGNPANFSYIRLTHTGSGDEFQLRQQVRITSPIHREISFTPDLVLMSSAADIEGEFDDGYANGKRRFFSIDSSHVIAAHECKSMNPFPELLVSFLGMLISAHQWLDYPHCRDVICEDGLHLAPTLFIGGTPSVWHSRMVTALSSAYPINVVAGMHAGTWDLSARAVNRFNLPA